jgi:membrane protein required for colicin V production
MRREAQVSHFYNIKPNEKMCVFDIIIGGIAILSFLSGLRKGLISEVASLVSIVLGVYGAIHFGYIVEEKLTSFVPTEHVGLVSFVVTVILVVVIVHFVGQLINRVVGMTILSVPNRIGGGVFSVIKVLFFVGCIISMVDYLGVGMEIVSPEQRAESYFYPIIDQVRSLIYPYFESIIGENKLHFIV